MYSEISTWTQHNSRQQNYVVKPQNMSTSNNKKELVVGTEVGIVHIRIEVSWTTPQMY